MLLEVKNLSGGYGNGDICKNISCTVDRGEVLSVIGPNGCGKTTLFRLLLGILNPTNGDIILDGVSSKEFKQKEFSRKIAYIPQYHHPIFSYTVLEVVLMGRASHFSMVSQPKKEDKQEAFKALEKMKISHLANKNYTALSGGQRQLVIIARALCQQPEILVMDEPGASLDYANQQRLMQVISDLAKQGYGVIMSTHSPEHPFTVAHNTLLLDKGYVAAFGKPEEVITPQVLLDVYGIEMDIVTVQDRNNNKRTLCLPVAI